MLGSMMKFDEEKRKLKSLHEKLKGLQFPKFSYINDLSNWIEELIEIDAYYAGLSLSISEGEKISKKDLFDLVQFRKKLNEIQPHLKKQEDLTIAKNCYEYLDTIQSIDSILRKMF